MDGNITDFFDNLREVLITENYDNDYKRTYWRQEAVSWEKSLYF